MLKKNGFANIWKIGRVGEKSVSVSMSQSRKKKDGPGYETTFGPCFVTLIGKAKEAVMADPMFAKMMAGEKGHINIRINDIGVDSSPRYVLGGTTVEKGTPGATFDSNIRIIVMDAEVMAPAGQNAAPITPGVVPGATPVTPVAPMPTPAPAPAPAAQGYTPGYTAPTYVPPVNPAPAAPVGGFAMDGEALPFQ